LLQVAPLSDHDKLVCILKDSNRNQGAGCCSHALMDQIVSMVNEMSKKEASEQKKAVVFDSKELSGGNTSKSSAPR